MGSYLFTVTEPSGREEEVILVRHGPAAEAGDDGTETADGTEAHEGTETDDGRDTEAGDDGTETDGPSVSAWKNFCMHEPDQRLDRGVGTGAAMRDGQIICPRHGSMFDAATGYCDNGEAAGQTLVEVDVTVRDGVVYLTDEGLSYSHAGGVDDDGLPDSTSHVSF
jgi:nitrite reductase/ring-hydroxylating ferredoxin subunit